LGLEFASKVRTCLNLVTCLFANEALVVFFELFELEVVAALDPNLRSL
jgi:hypothetical protein